MVKINEIKETTAKLYKDKELVGEITSYLQLQDIRIQIKEAKAEGYFIDWNDHRINIDKNGLLSDWPLGFFDIVDDQLDTLLGLE